jgi:hypothetical protein
MVKVKANQAAFEAGQLAERMAHGYYAHSAAIAVATQPDAPTLVPATLPRMTVPLGIVQRKDRTEHVFDFRYFLRLASASPEITGELPRVWLAGSLLAVGDTLSRNDYFDRAPELELVRHLRNGITHGNRFVIRKPDKRKKFPAHNRDAWVRSNKKTIFEISPALNGQPVLFNYLGAGDVVDVLLSVGIYLTRMGNGDPLRLPPP